MRWVSTWLAAGVFAAALLLLSRVVAEPPPIDQVKQALKRQESWLAKAPTGPGWNQYLQTDQLKEQLGKGPDADRASILEVLGKYQTDPPGLKMPLFLATRKALEVWDVALTQKSLLIQASKRIVAGGINRIIDEDMKIHENILGTDVHSLWAHTNATVKSSLIPDATRAIIQVNLNGQTQAKTVGYHGRVTVYSHGTTSLEGHKQIVLDENAFMTLCPWVHCGTSTCIDCIDICGGPIIRRIATNRVYGSVGAAQAEAAKHTEGHLRDRLNRDVGRTVANADRTFQDKFRTPLNRKNAFPQPLTFSTNQDWLNIVALQPGANQIGVIPSPLEMSSDNELSIRLHESLVGSYGDVLAPGKSSRMMAYWRGMRNYKEEAYSKAEFLDLLLCLSETGAPVAVSDGHGGMQPRERDMDLVISDRDFARLMHDRFGMDTSNEAAFKAEFDKLTQAIYDERVWSLQQTGYHSSLSHQQYDTYLAGLLVPADQYKEFMEGKIKCPISFDDAIRLIRDQSTSINYKSIKYADKSPIDIQFRDNQIHAVLHIQSTTEKDLRGDPPTRVENQFPCEAYVTYNVSLQNGTAVFDRVEGEYGVRAPDLTAEEQAKLSSQQIRKRNEILRRALPRDLFGTADPDASSGAAADEEPPIFPKQQVDTGLRLHGRWEKNLGILPWTQLESRDGWLAIGWTIAEK